MARLNISKPPFDLVLADLTPAGTTSQSLKLLEAVRASDDPDVAGVRVIICTNVDTNRLFSWQSGVDGFLVRPFHADELLETVREALARSDGERTAHREEQVRHSTSS
ncbi:MAG: hypothetical protein U5R31_16025 [Acidimicrobiia bacterium]|nr:hypothetical protein [Acidimicrobiia bacterium]